MIESGMNASNGVAEIKHIVFLDWYQILCIITKWLDVKTAFFPVMRCNIYLSICRSNRAFLILRIRLMGHNLLLKINFQIFCIVNFTMHILSKQLCWTCINAIKWFSVVQSGHSLLLVRDECVRLISIWQ